MEKDYLILKRALANRPSGEWNEDDYNVLAEGVVVGRTMKAPAVTARHSVTRGAAMAAFAKS